MFLVGIISWWYGDGWKRRVAISTDRIKSSIDFFSIKQMFLTLFEPFRQISADKPDGSLNIILQSFLNRLISRFVGFFMRMSMIIIGCINILLQTIFGVCIIFLWGLIPLIPFTGIILSILRVSF